MKPWLSSAAAGLSCVFTAALYSAPVSPVIVNPATGRQYVLLHVATWTDAEQSALRIGGHLATVRNQAEQDWIFTTFAPYGNFQKLIWIGLNDAAREGKFVWASGESVTYTNWAAGEPNNTVNEDYVSLFYAGHSEEGKWNDFGNVLTDPAAIRFHGLVELTPGSSVLLIPTGTRWRYHDGGINLGTAWRASSYDDGGWSDGLAPFGYGDGDEATVISYGSDPNNKHITTYFRCSFVVTNRSIIRGLTLSALRDDGGIVYLNGSEIARQNMPAGAITFTTLASGAVSGADEVTNFHSSFIDPALLLEGTNVLAVEIHQNDPGSSDLSFNLQLLAKHNLLPVVSLVEPCSGEMLGIPRDLVLRATATDDESVTNVTFLVDGSPVASETIAPYGAVVTNFAKTSATLLAIATDNRGLMATSAPVSIVLKPALIAANSVWKYLDNGTDLGTAWRKTPYDDSAWASGFAQLGYGDGDEATVISYGTDPANKHITTYFRQRFFVPEPSGFANLLLRLIRDDGAVVYLNNQEVFRSNMPVTDEISFRTLADSVTDGNEESRIFEVPISASLLLAGTNALAVEVHQADPGSSDVSFSLELLGEPIRRAPRLVWFPAGHGVRISWPLAAVGYALESTPSLTPPVRWLPLSAAPTSESGYWQVTIPHPERQVFYRLREE